jgi:putative integral membrane protein (TIGR02587 family)
MPATFRADFSPRANRDYAVGLGRAFGGAILFGLPLLMTMEMWWFGLYLERGRLLLFVALDLLLLTGLSHFTGFEHTERLADEIVDALASFGVGIIASCGVLAAFGLLTPAMTADELIGKVVVQAIPASIGAAVANKQLASGDDSDEQRERKAGYAGQLFLMVAGAVFLSFNVAPTEEMALIAFEMTPWHALALAALTLVLLHAFVYSVGFAGQEQRPEGSRFTTVFLQYTVAGYAIALLVSLYVLWTFGRTDGLGMPLLVMMTVVLGFPSALGAAVARLIV